MDEYFRERPRPYHPDIDRGICLVTMKNETRPTGSYRFRVFKYPSDVDVLEEVVEIAPDHPTACEIFANRIRMMAIRIYISSPKVYLSDFKGGTDDRFRKAWFAAKKIKWETSFPAAKFEPLMNELVSAQALTEKEARSFMRLTPPELYRVIREKYLLRWNIFELCKNPPRKALPGGRVITLAKALEAAPRLTKMDIWAPVKDGFMEIETVLHLGYQKEENAPVERVTRLFWTSYPQALCHEYRKAVKNGHHLKSVKRVWFLCRSIILDGERYPSSLVREAEEYVRVISSSPLVNGYIAQLAKAASQFKIVLGMSVGSHCIPAKDFPIERVMTQIMNATTFVRDAKAYRERELYQALDAMTEAIFIPFEQKFGENTIGSVRTAMRQKEFIASVAEHVERVVLHLSTCVNERSKSWRKKNLPDIGRFIRTIDDRASSSS